MKENEKKHQTKPKQKLENWIKHSIDGDSVSIVFVQSDLNWI